MMLAVAIVLILVALVAILLGSQGSSPGVSVSCDLFAAPGGSRSDPGTARAPTDATGLVRALRPGEVGCLRGGEYRFAELKLIRPRIELSSAPGEVATLRGRLWVAAGADGVTVRDLVLDGENEARLPSPTVDADGATFEADDVTNHHTSICFDIGNREFGRATGTTIEDSRIHGCGETPSTNQEHGIYLSDAGATTIEADWIYDNTDRGIQLYPDVQGTRIIDNVIYGNGEGIIFSGNDEVAASGNLVEGNVIAESRIRRNVESFYLPGAPIGSGNLVTGNCLYGAATSFYAGPDGSGVESEPRGFAVTDNVVGRPEFEDPAAADFRLRPGSPCAEVGAATAGVPGPGANS